MLEQRGRAVESQSEAPPLTRCQLNPEDSDVIVHSPKTARPKQTFRHGRKNAELED